MSPPPASADWRHWSWWFATLAGIGRLPKAPGTWGSLVTALAAFAIFPYISIYYKIILILFITLTGILASAAYAARHRVDDPQDVVIDEVAGQLLALICAPPHWAWYLAGFALFRLFDITKPFPANWCDRNLKGGV
ncbi:MAG: phosphatidylglycerophosphatase A, partial [Rhodospirillales bacterium]|nr:phosphatidylglycerophosphatase A [Rhodospirillales bacterium]